MRAIILFLAAMLLAACNLSTTGPTDEPLNTPTTTDSAAGKPSVTISSPEEGSEVVVGDEVFISANATDTVGVTEVQLIANDQIVKRVFSESVSGDKTMNALLDYTPTTTGEIELQVIARRGSVASDPAAIMLNVRSSQSLVTATIAPQTDVPVIDPSDPTCRALTNTALRLRSTPDTSTNANIITVLNSGAVTPIIGRLGNNTWWQVRYGGNIGWIAAEYTTVYGFCTGVPVVATYAPPPPTPIRPTYTYIPLPTWTPYPSQTPVPAPADLTITTVVGPQELTIPADPDATVTANYSVTIVNQGQQRSGQFANTLTVLPGGAALDLGIVSNLRSQEVILLSLDVTFTAPGTYNLQIVADAGNAVVESDEANNSLFYEVVVVAAALP
ncbi:MAG: SH3 domain-containing protein [Anaerolineae bacterium]|nr:SH3 domain-containing protein [Anaerolineae bacterium]